MRITAQLWRFILCSTVLIATGAATWIDPPPAGAVPQPGTAARSDSRVSTSPQLEASVTPQSPGNSAAASGITVARWEFGPAIPGRPLYLRMTLDGTQAAIDRMHTGPLMIQVHWMREGAGATPGAPNLVTDLTIGRAGLAGTFEEQVRRKGFFEWHSWARKDALGPGTWTVSLTYPDGQPLLCGQDAQPCRFRINVG